MRAKTTDGKMAASMVSWKVAMSAALLVEKRVDERAAKKGGKMVF